MKKVLLVLGLCVAIVAANAQAAQTQTATPKAKTAQVAPKAGKNEIKEADLLAPIKADYVKQVVGAKFDKAFKMEKPGKEGGVYVVVVKKDEVTWKLIYDKDGKFIKKDEAKPHVKKAPATPEAK